MARSLSDSGNLIQHDLATTNLRVSVTPSDCAAHDGDCAPALNGAVAACRHLQQLRVDLATAGGIAGTAPQCSVVLSPGVYRVQCPPGSGAYVGGPSAVDLSNTTDLTFGAESADAPAQLECDCAWWSDAFFVRGCVRPRARVCVCVCGCLRVRERAVRIAPITGTCRRHHRHHHHHIRLVLLLPAFLLSCSC